MAQLWKPTWNKEIEKWTAKFISQNRWRCDSINSHNDLMQDAYLVFDKVVRTYPRVVEPQNFMALYKRALINKIHDKSLYRTRRLAAEVETDADVSEMYSGSIGETTNSGYIAALLAELPPEMHEVINAILNDKYKPPRRRTKMKVRENLSMRVAKALSLPKGADPVLALRQILSPEG